MLFFTLFMASSCAKSEEELTRVKAPLRNYTVTARLDNKQAGTDSKATGILKGTYSETTKLFTYKLSYEGLTPTLIKIEKGAKGALGTVIVEIARNDSSYYKSPLIGGKKLNSLQERDLIKGLWFISIESASYKPNEIRGMVTIKQK